METEALYAQETKQFDLGKALIKREEELKKTEQKAAVPLVNAPSTPKPLEEEAFYGLAGEIVHAIEPHSEADPAALLIQQLTAFGNVIGRTAYFMAEADKHYTNLYDLLVGDTSKGRKGTSWGRIECILKAIDEEWVKERRQSGLTSGEGLIYHVRDSVISEDPNSDDGMDVKDEGVQDKRLLLYESEFASVLRLLGRDGNTLSPVVRNAWDTGRLSTLSKNSPTKATDAHISIIGHITKDELKRYLNSTEAGNGFANRFLFVYVKRSKELPEGGRIHEVNFTKMVNSLRDAVEFAKKVGEIKRDADARKIWFKVYPTLSEGKDGLFGAVTARAEAQVMRIACIYALLDKSAIIRKEHLAAALAVWEYSEASAKYIFGDSLGDPVADEINRMLINSPDGLNRTNINKLFSGNRSSNQIGRALGSLLSQGQAYYENHKSDGGRDSEIWFSVKHRT